MLTKSQMPWSQLMKASLLLRIATPVLLLLLSTAANAGLMTCGDTYRKASLNSAESCKSQTLGSTVKSSDLTAIFGGTWVKQGELTGNGSNGLFSVSGASWGNEDVNGTWLINSSFWNTYGSALITIHVGGGQKNAVDNFEFVVTPNSLSGTWSYDKLKGKGGGLSNIKLWGSGKPTIKVPEPSALFLLLIGLFSLGFVRRVAR
jgi:hypothetical protein